MYRISIIVFQTFLTLGQGVLTIGGFVNGETGFFIALIGRVIFGLGGESLNVC
jgi:hypothetical protein